MDATQNVLNESQVWALTDSIMLDVNVWSFDKDINKYELGTLISRVIRPRVRAILCTLTNATYEDIVKVVHDKLNLNDLFDNRHKYLN
jgi:hypothetical protein